MAICFVCISFDMKENMKETKYKIVYMFQPWVALITEIQVIFKCYFFDKWVLILFWLYLIFGFVLYLFYRIKNNRKE